MGKPSAPAPPNYAQAAQQTAQGNLSNAIVAQTGNMVNQVTPQGNVTYNATPTGYINGQGNNLTPSQFGALSPADQQGYVPINQWTQTVSLSPQGQAAYNQNQAINQQLGNIAQQGVGYVQQALNQPLSNPGQAVQSGPENASQIKTNAGNPNLLNQQVTDALYKQQTQYLDPQFQQGQANLENQLANQGISPGTEAYTRAMQNFDLQKQQAYGNAMQTAIGQGVGASSSLYGQQLAGMQAGNQALGQQFNQGLANAQLFNQGLQQNFQNAQALQQNPINMLNAVRTGQQMQVTPQPQVGVSNPGQMVTPGGANMLGAAQAQNQAALGAYNAQVGQQNAMLGGLANLGSAYMISPYTLA